MSNLGVLGGTFDPVHLGHLAVAEEARQQLDLAEVVFVPAGNPYFKELAFISPPEHRVNMLNLALADRPYFKISLMEIKHPGPSYSVDTIAKMKRQLNSGDEIFFIVGWDSLLTLPRWEQPERLISLCKIVVATRPGYPRPDASFIEPDLPGVTQRTVILDKPLIDISATGIRERVHKGLPIDNLVPAAVAKYIREHKLYLNKKSR